MIKPACCSVTAVPGTDPYNARTVCAEHMADGWLVVNPGQPYAEVDHADRWPCGCRVTTLRQRFLEKCATHTIGALACCAQARTVPCVCAYSYLCGVHGERHIGTHD